MADAPSADGRPRPAGRTPIWWLRCGAAVVLATLAGVPLAAGGLGAIFGDGGPTPQTWSWVPTPILLVLALLLLAATVLAPGCSKRRRWAIAIVIVVVAVIAGRLVLFDIGWTVGGTPAGSMRLVHWNASAVRGAEADLARGGLRATAADHIVLTLPSEVLFRGGAAAFESDGYTVAYAGVFAIATRARLVRARPLFAREQVSMAVFEIDEEDGRPPIVVWAVDLPSDPDRLRSDVVRALITRIERVDPPEPDIVVGDFNMIRESRAMARVFRPDRNAFALAGRGWPGTFPREMPLWHIDHCFVGERVAATRWRTVDLGAGRHLAQEVTYVRRSADARADSSGAS